MVDDEPSGGVGSAEMVMLDVDGSLGEDNINGVDFDDDDGDGAGIVGVVLEICVDAGVSLTGVGFSGVSLAGKVLTLGCFNVVS